eukprot:756247-Hanusia_phi.AAC.1
MRRAKVGKLEYTVDRSPFSEKAGFSPVFINRKQPVPYLTQAVSAQLNFSGLTWALQTTEGLNNRMIGKQPWLQTLEQISSSQFNVSRFMSIVPCLKREQYCEIDLGGKRTGGGGGGTESEGAREEGKRRQEMHRPGPGSREEERKIQGGKEERGWAGEGGLRGGQRELQVEVHPRPLRLF